MARRSEKPLIKVTLRILKSNWDELQEMASLQDVSPNRIVREMLDSYLTQSRALVRRNIDKLPPPPAFSMEELQDV